MEWYSLVETLVQAHFPEQWSADTSLAYYNGICADAVLVRL